MRRRQLSGRKGSNAIQLGTLQETLINQVSALTKLAIVAFSVSLALVGLFVLLSGEVTLPTRQPPRQFHFGGLSLFLLGASPLVAGITTLAVARGNLHRESSATQIAVGVSIAALGLAFVLARKY